MVPSMEGRHHEIDWLRMLSMLMIFFFHCARFFDRDFWHVKNNQLDFGMTVFVAIVSQWIMPLFFLLSAISAYHSLKSRKDGEYITERLKRLAIPFIFGTFLLIPPQVYIERVSNGQFSGSFIEFFPKYFHGFYGFGGNFAWMGLHLWYLQMLFIFSLLTLPLFRYLGQHEKLNSMAKTASLFYAPGAIFLLAIPLALMELLVNLYHNSIGSRDFGGWSPLTYLIFFILGYLVTWRKHNKQSMTRQRISSLMLGLMATTMGYYLLQSGYSSRSPFFSFLRAFNSWFWIVSIIGFGTRYLTFNNRLLEYGNEAVLPFYILHQTVIVLLGYCISAWDTNVIVKFTLISTGSLAVILAFYDIVIKRTKLVRFLFGMKR